ncbi:MAG: hypothetical protein AB9895_02575 [Negativicutes bacterium]
MKVHRFFLLSQSRIFKKIFHRIVTSSNKRRTIYDYIRLYS